MVYITLIVLIFALLFLWKIHGIKLLIYPPTYFLLIWIFSLISFLLYTNLINESLIYFMPKYFDELMQFILFTVISLIIVNKLTEKKISDFFVKWAPPTTLHISIKILIIVIFIICIYRFASYGSLDYGEIRSNFLARERGLTSIGVLDFVFNLIVGFNTPLILLTGYIIGIPNIKNKKIFFVPLFSGLLVGLSMGGRAAIINSIFLFLISFFIAQTQYTRLSTNVLKKYIKYAGIAFLFFSLFSTFVNTSRESRNNFEEYSYLKPFAGILQYMVAHYPGYQLDRTYGVTEEIEPGKRTLQGITNFELPFLSQITGTPLSLNSLLWDRDDKTFGRTLDNYGGWLNTTATVYIHIYDDFGYGLSFLVILLFVILTQYIYIQMNEKKHSTIFSIFPYYIIAILWFKSIFSSEIVGNWLTNPFFTFLIFSFIVRLTKIKRLKKNYSNSALSNAF